MKTKKKANNQIKSIKFWIGIFLVLILVSAAFYNYRRYTYEDPYLKFFEIIGKVIENLINALTYALCAINLCPGAETWSILIALAIFFLIAWYISKDDSSSQQQEQSSREEGN